MDSRNAIAFYTLMVIITFWYAITRQPETSFTFRMAKCWGDPDSLISKRESKPVVDAHLGINALMGCVHGINEIVLW